MAGLNLNRRGPTLLQSRLAEAHLDRYLISILVHPRYTWVSSTLVSSGGFRLQGGLPGQGCELGNAASSCWGAAQISRRVSSWPSRQCP